MLVDIARRVLAGEPVDVTMGHVNVIWQGDANAMALRCLAHATTPTSPINVSGPETISVRWAVRALAERLGIEATVTGTESDTAWLTNTAQANRLFGYPKVPLARLMDWVADWVAGGNPLLNKPTKFEIRDGNY